MKTFFESEGVAEPFKFRINKGYGFCRLIENNKVEGPAIINYESGEFFIG